ncbi:carbohydrate ABC transporter permease [Deinococcus sp. UYEF24]
MTSRTQHEPSSARPDDALVGRSGKPKHNLQRGEALTAWVFVLPALIGFALFYAWPTVRSVSISFTDWNMLSPARPVGLANYQKLLNDAVFWQSLKATGVYVLWNIPLQTVLALLLALLLQRFSRSSFLRSVVIAPYLLPGVVVGLMGLWMLNPELGILNAALGWLGLHTQPFLGSIQQAMPTIASINTWQYTGYTSLLLYTGMQSIPLSVYEAARIDGAQGARQFFSITLPLLRPVMAFVVITSLIGSFQIFDTIAITTQGGPVNATRVIVWYIYEQAFTLYNMGYATAIAVVLFAVLLLVTVVQLRLFRADSSDLE